MFGDDVGLAEGGASKLYWIELDAGASEHDSGVEREVRLTSQSLSECVQDAREFIPGAVADVLAKDLRRMRRCAVHANLPAHRASPGSHGEAGIAGSVLEPDRDVGSPRSRGKRLSCRAQRLAGILFVP